MIIRKLGECSVSVKLDKRELNVLGLNHDDFKYATSGAKDFIDKVLNSLEEEGILEDLKEAPIGLRVCIDESKDINLLIEKMDLDDLANLEAMDTPKELELPSEIKEFLERLVGKSTGNQEEDREENEVRKDVKSECTSKVKVNTKTQKCNEEFTCMYCFDILDDVIKVSSKIHTMLGEDVNLICNSKLFKHTGKYYMVLSFENVKRSDLNLILSGVVTEFGGEEETRNKDILIDFMNEHAEVIVKSDVIGKLGNL